jgi:2-keto-4-pentenoate hydratase/2-oxohepta-3-ene-1,7-dioic acid hydratase in catechol pathway
MRTIKREEGHGVPMLRWTSGREAMEAGTVFCIGRNYADHARELGNDIPDEPLVFLKSRNSILLDKSTIHIPSYSNELHYEGEMVLLVGGTKSQPKISGVAIGLDMTLRDIQSNIKQKGHPWTKAKNFPGSAIISDIYDLDTHEGDFELSRLTIKTWVNGELCQNGDTSDMIFESNMLLDYLNKTYGTIPGDLIFTGTPQGVGELKKGDEIVVELHKGDKTLCSAKATIT